MGSSGSSSDSTDKTKSPQIKGCLPPHCTPAVMGQGTTHRCGQDDEQIGAESHPDGNVSRHAHGGINPELNRYHDETATHPQQARGKANNHSCHQQGNNALYFHRKTSLALC